MPETTTTTETTRQVFVSLDNLKTYDRLIRQVMTAEDAKALKTVTLSEDKTKLLFYTKSQPVGDATPAFEIELPKEDLTGLMGKVSGATEGNVAVLKADGTLKDTGVAIADLATLEAVATEVQQQISARSFLEKKIVTELPAPEAAKENIIYMVKDESVTNGDAYVEYMKIGAEVVQIGTTSISLAGYSTTEEVTGLINTAKTQAISEAAADATSKADQALSDAKDYTNTEVATVTSRVDGHDTKIGELETATSGNATKIEDANKLITAQAQRLTALETYNQNIEFATEEDIRAMFTTPAPQA